MKTSTFIALSIGAVYLVATDGRAQVGHDAAEHRSFDRRTQALRVGQGASPASMESEAGLKGRNPFVTVSRDEIIGAPRLINAKRGFLTGPSGREGVVSDEVLAAFPESDPHRVIKAFVREHAGLFGHGDEALAEASVRRDYVTAHNGLRSVTWEQRLDGIRVFDGLFTAHVSRDGELVSLSSRFVGNPRAAADRGNPNARAIIARSRISAVEAVKLAGGSMGVDLQQRNLSPQGDATGSGRKQKIQGDGLVGPASVELIWLPMNRDSMRLCWEVILTTVTPQFERNLVLLDAETGEVNVVRSLTSHISDATYNVYTSDSPSPFSPGWPDPSNLQPAFTNRVLVTLSALDTNASPNGWIDDGDNETQGNNAIAFVDRNLDLVQDGPLPQGMGTNRVFDFPLDLSQLPGTYGPAATVQLFYQANRYHDLMYQFGFTEEAGNFQLDNFNRGGLDGDPVICLAQAGADVGNSDNAVFAQSFDGDSGIAAMFVFSGPNPDRDGSLDQEILVHELTHGLSFRLVGGGFGIFQLQTVGMGEGWSDFYGLSLLSEPGDDPNANYAAGGYASYLFAGFQFDENYYYGIRRYPYSTDLLKNPLTFKDIDPTQADPHFGVPTSPIFGGSDPSEVHNQGEVWCVALWEMRARLVQKYGGLVGNQEAIQLVTDGMKLSPENPNFLEARDAIIQADFVNTGGVNYDDIWIAFAKRGMGASAQSPPSFTTIGVVEAYDVPPDVVTGIEVPIGIMRVRITPPGLAVLLADTTNSVFLRITDGLPVTNATITADIVGGGSLPFINDGADPDLVADDGVYSASLVTPPTEGILTINIVITAPDKDPSTNVVSYVIVGPPSNDDFADGIKVPVGGAGYVANNTLATLEAGEPIHAGVITADKSLWWKYSSPVSTNVLVDAGGSDFRAIVAVYSNSVLPSLQPVASGIGSIARRGPFARFNAQAGITYHIAVASYDEFTGGSMRLTVAPGGQPDTNAPSVTVTTPPSGVIVTTNRLSLAGTAVEPGPSPTGIQNILITVNPATGLPTTTVVPMPRPAVGPLNTNWSAIVGLVPGPNRIQVMATDFAGNRSLPVTLRVTLRSLEPRNDFFANATTLTNAGVDSVNTLNATKEPGEPFHAGVFGGRSAWWKFTAPDDGVLTVSTTNSSFDTVMALYTGTAVSNLTLVASNDDAGDGSFGSFSEITQAVRSNETYRIAVDGYEAAGGVVFLTNYFEAGLVFRVTITTDGPGSVVPGSTDVAANSTLDLTAIPSQYHVFDMWSGAFTSVDNPLSVLVQSNLTLTASFRPMNYTDGFESGNLGQLAWQTSGNQPWVVRTNVVAAGQFAARSGPITHGQTSSLRITTNFVTGFVSFDYKVSSEPNFDRLQFFVDNLVQQTWSGEIGWANFAYPIIAGSHTLEWRYSKDATLSQGLDAAFIDNLILPIDVPVSAASAAYLTVQRISDGTALVDLYGQRDQTYIFQASHNLVDWHSFSTNVALGGYCRAVDYASRTNAACYYRAVAIGH